MAASDRRMTWGHQIDTAVVDRRGRRPSAGSQLISVSTRSKGSDEVGVLDHRLKSGVPRDSRLPKHLRRLVETAWALAEQPTLSEYHLRLWAHTCGFRGHFATKSRRYSTTFGALRAERQRWRLAAVEHDLAGEEASSDEDVAREWSYEGSGYLTAGDACLARNVEDELRLARFVAREEGTARSTQVGPGEASGKVGIHEGD